MDKKEKLREYIQRNEAAFAKLKEAVIESTDAEGQLAYGVGAAGFVVYIICKACGPESLIGWAEGLLIVTTAATAVPAINKASYAADNRSACSDPNIFHMARKITESPPLLVSLPVMCVCAFTAVRHSMILESIVAVLTVCSIIWEEAGRRRRIRKAYKETADICRDVCAAMQSDIIKIREAVQSTGPDAKPYIKGDRMITVNEDGDIRAVDADTVFEKDIYCEDTADGMSQILTDKDIAELYIKSMHMEEIYSKKEIEAMAAPAIRRTYGSAVRRSDTKAA